MNDCVSASLMSLPTVATFNTNSTLARELVVVLARYSSTCCTMFGTPCVVPAMGPVRAPEYA